MTASAHIQTGGGMLRSLLAVSGVSFVSLLTGLAMNVAVAAVIGASHTKDAFDVAYTFPELESLNWRSLHIESLTQLLTWLWQAPTSPALRRLADCTCAAGEPLIDLLAP